MTPHAKPSEVLDSINYLSHFADKLDPDANKRLIEPVLKLLVSTLVLYAFFKLVEAIGFMSPLEYLPDTIAMALETACMIAASIGALAVSFGMGHIDKTPAGTDSIMLSSVIKDVVGVRKDIGLKDDSERQPLLENRF